MIGAAVSDLRARRGRALLAALGILAASLMLGVAATVGYGLSTGFERSAAEADLPDVIVRFSPEERRAVHERLRRLPNLDATAYRYEVTDVRLRAAGGSTRRGILQVVDPGRRRGYAIVAGRDVRPSSPGEVVVEQGLAQAWDLEVGEAVRVGRRGGTAFRVVGFSMSPDNVAYPLAPTARVLIARAEVERLFGAETEPTTNLALIWARDPAHVDVLLEQARLSSAGVENLRFVTRSGVRVLVDEAAGLVVALLAAFSLVTIGVAAVMLGSAAQGEVQRRLPAIGVQRALGVTPGEVVRTMSLAALLLAGPAALIGLLAGALVSAGPSERLLRSLNNLEPGAGELALVLGAVWLGAVALTVAASAWPAWRAARRPAASVLRGGDLARARSSGRGREWNPTLKASKSTHTPRRTTSAPASGLTALGVRLGTARRLRFGALVAVLSSSAAAILLLLALAGLLQQLRDDPGTLGKRYQVTARIDADAAAEIRQIDGVQAASPRYQVQATASYALGSPVRLVAYPGDHTVFEAPPLAEGRRVRGAGEAEVGVGLAEALGLSVGGRLAVQLPGGTEETFRVVGVVRALEADGRLAYVRPDRLLAADPDLQGTVSVRLTDDADRAAVNFALADLGAGTQTLGGAQTDNRAFLGVLAVLLRLVAFTVALVCLYALVQALVLVARERRLALALLRAVGAGSGDVARVLAGAAAAALVPAALAGVLLERLALGPFVADLAADYADLPLAASAAEIAIVVGGLAVIGAVACALAARRVSREPIVTGLRGTSE